MKLILGNKDKHGKLIQSEEEAEEWENMVEEVDIDGDGEIQFSEFKAMMLKLLNKQEEKPNFNNSQGGPDGVGPSGGKKKRPKNAKNEQKNKAKKKKHKQSALKGEEAKE